MIATLPSVEIAMEPTGRPRVLFATPPDPLCRAVVVVPARDEERALPSMLDALRMQLGTDGKALPHASYEVLLLLNNCTDRSAEVAERYGARYPGLRLHVASCMLAAEFAHVGTARRMLMDEACSRLEWIVATGESGKQPVILTTDADTEVAPDWIARNLLAMDAGAEVVGGVIHLRPGELEALDSGVRLCYQRDRSLQTLVARLESLLDPDPADPWPRHLEHFGASLACTAEVYRRSGGLPAVKPLEDVAFIDALRRVGARIRHAPEVHIYTSARLDGRAEVGLSGQLRHWQHDCARAAPHTVDSAEWMVHRFRSIGLLRRLHGGDAALLSELPTAWQGKVETLLGQALSFPAFLEELDCNQVIDEMFCGQRRGEITQVIEQVQEQIDRLERRGPRR